MVMKINIRVHGFEKSMFSLSTNHYEITKYLTMICTAPMPEIFGSSRTQNKMNRFNVFNNLIRNLKFSSNIASLSLIHIN